MDQHTIETFKHKLEEELIKVEAELKETGVLTEAGSWEAGGGDIDETATEDDELADRMEEFGENSAENDALKTQLRNIKRALTKIEDGSYGICEFSGEEIEQDRLEAIPSARTCKSHMDEEAELGA